MISIEVLRDCLKRYDCFYLYDENTITESVARLKENFPQVKFLYSIKCNSNPHVLRAVFAQGLGADAASAGEVAMAREAGLSEDEIYYSAPGKSIEDIKNTMDKATLIADSLDEIKRIQSLAEQAGSMVKIGIRINPDFSFAGDVGQPSKFGIDEEQAVSFLRRTPCKNVKISGIHVHLKSQELNMDTLASYYRRMLALSEKFDSLCDGLDYINMGSGMGVPYAPGDIPLDVESLGTAVQREIGKYKAAHPNTKIIIEVGRYAVCESGIYVTKVMDRKISHGKTYLILKNTLNGFLRPSLARLVASYSEEALPCGSEPLFTSKDAFKIRVMKEGPASETVTLAGNLCTGTDVIAEDILLPRLECGDAVIITNAGSYAAVLSPIQFSSQEKPVELFLRQSGVIA